MALAFLSFSFHDFFGNFYPRIFTLSQKAYGIKICSWDGISPEKTPLGSLESWINKLDRSLRKLRKNMKIKNKAVDDGKEFIISQGPILVKQGVSIRS